VWGQGGEMNQSLYAHMNYKKKCARKFKKGGWEGKDKKE
jgi:hypothetical protein